MIRLTLRKEFVDHRRDARSVIGSLVLPVLGPVLLFAVWQLVISAEWIKPVLLPPPGDTLAHLWGAVSSGAIQVSSAGSCELQNSPLCPPGEKPPAGGWGSCAMNCLVAP